MDAWRMTQKCHVAHKRKRPSEPIRWMSNKIRAVTMILRVNGTVACPSHGIHRVIPLSVVGDPYPPMFAGQSPAVDGKAMVLNMDLPLLVLGGYLLLFKSCY